MDWVYLPPWGMRLPVLVTVLLVLFLVIRAWRERKLVKWPRQGLFLAARLLVIGAIAAIALNPTAFRARTEKGKPALVVLLDTSRTMSVRDVDGAPRIEKALSALHDKDVLTKLKAEFKLDWRRFDSESRPLDLATIKAHDAIGSASELGSAVMAAVGDLAEERTQAGVLLISDGRETGARATDAARLALARSAPIWSWCLGGEVPRRDLYIEAPNSEVLAMSGAEVDLTAVLHQVGFDDRVFRVEVLLEDKCVHTLEATPGKEGSAPLKFTIKAPQEKGERRYVFRTRVDDQDGRRVSAERSVFLRILGEKMRVLVVEGRPHWDTKFLVQSLKRNAHIDLTAIYRLSDKRQFAVVSENKEEKRVTQDLFPRDAEAFARFDIIVMGQGCDAFFDDKTEELLTDYVARRGGSLVFSRGRPYGQRFAPLLKLEPLVWGHGIEQGVRLATEMEREADQIFEAATPDELGRVIERLPAFDEVRQTVGAKPLAVILAHSNGSAGAGSTAGPGGALGESGDGSAIMAYHLYGLGRVVSINAGGLWRWSFREKGKEEDEFRYDRLWGNLFRWLLAGSDFLAGHDVALRSDRRLYTDEQKLRFLIRTRGLDSKVYRPRLIIERDGKQTEVEPSSQAGGAAYVAEAGPFQPGFYRVELQNNLGTPKSLSMLVEVVSGSVEDRHMSADPALMRRISEISEGQVINAADLPRLGEIVRRWQAKRELAEEKQALWDHAWLPVALMLLLGTEWFLRRREGLL